MSDINSTRLPVALAIVAVGPYIGGDANFTLTRGERWAQHLSNDVTIVLICFVFLAFVKYLVY